MSRIFITGASGFVGSALQTALGDRPVRLLMRRRTSEPGTGASERVEIVVGDVTDASSLHGLMDGCDTVIHLVAIISEEGGATFDKVIHHGTVNVVAEANRAGIGRFLHMSALGTRNDPRYGYFLAKYRAEQAVKESGIPWTIFRPSVIFGPGDEFITTLAQLVRRAPVIPVVGSGESKFQPVAVAQVAQAFVRALDDPATIDQTYELGGGKTYTYDEMIGVIAAELKKQKPRVHVPVGLMTPVVQLAKVLPKQLRPPVTEEQLKMLAIDNCTDHSAIAKLTGQPALSLEGNLSYLRS